MAKGAHFICHRQDNRWENMFPVDPRVFVYDSGFWDIPADDAKALVGGLIFLHESKSDDAGFVGRVLEQREVDKPEFAHARRIVFRVKAVAMRRAKWRGRSDARAHYGGLVDLD